MVAKYNNKNEKGIRTTSALRQKRYIEKITIDKIKFQGKKENFNISNSHWLSNEQRELNVDKKLYLSQSEIKRLKELIRNIDFVYPNALRKNGLMEWCVKICIFYEISLDQFRSKRRHKNLVQARTDFCHAVYNYTEFNIMQISKFMNRHHTDVLHHLNKKQPKNIKKIC